MSAARKAERTKKPPLLKRIRRTVRRVRSRRGGTDAYEVPTAPDLTIDTVSVAPEDNARAILDLLVECGFVRSDETPAGSHGTPAPRSGPATTDDRVG